MSWLAGCAAGLGLAATAAPTAAIPEADHAFRRALVDHLVQKGFTSEKALELLDCASLSWNLHSTQGFIIGAEQSYTALPFNVRRYTTFPAYFSKATDDVEQLFDRFMDGLAVGAVTGSRVAVDVSERLQAELSSHFGHQQGVSFRAALHTTTNTEQMKIINEIQGRGCVLPVLERASDPSRLCAMAQQLRVDVTTFTAAVSTIVEGTNSCTSIADAFSPSGGATTTDAHTSAAAACVLDACDSAAQLARLLPNIFGCPLAKLSLEGQHCMQQLMDTRVSLSAALGCEQAAKMESKPAVYLLEQALHQLVTVTQPGRSASAPDSATSLHFAIIQAQASEAEAQVAVVRQEVEQRVAEAEAQVAVVRQEVEQRVAETEQRLRAEMQVLEKHFEERMQLQVQLSSQTATAQVQAVLNISMSEVARVETQLGARLDNVEQRTWDAEAALSGLEQQAAQGQEVLVQHRAAIDKGKNEQQLMKDQMERQGHGLAEAFNTDARHRGAMHTALRQVEADAAAAAEQLRSEQKAAERRLRREQTTAGRLLHAEQARQNKAIRSLKRRAGMDSEEEDNADDGGQVKKARQDDVSAAAAAAARDPLVPLPNGSQAATPGHTKASPAAGSTNIVPMGAGMPGMGSGLFGTPAAIPAFPLGQYQSGHFGMQPAGAEQPGRLGVGGMDGQGFGAAYDVPAAVSQGQYEQQAGAGLDGWAAAQYDVPATVPQGQYEQQAGAGLDGWAAAQYDVPATVPQGQYEQQAGAGLDGWAAAQYAAPATMPQGQYEQQAGAGLGGQAAAARGALFSSEFTSLW